ncbi:MAG: HNH endonuclease [Deltaproteobacteria bacterium]|nr:HNH endonuclease [Deltaproteobacteria bacterium]
MNGCVANTDFDWYAFLEAQPRLDEVNFWQPSGGRNRFHVVSPGEPFFFRLKSPHNAIAGFGWFARHERSVRSSLAWGAFGPKNGAPDLATMRHRIEAYRSSPSQATDPEVGCLMIANPIFFPRGQWIEQPRDWHPSIQVWKRYDLTVGEGLRLLRECHLGGPIPAHEERARYGPAQLVRPRLGQGTFRIAVNAAYEGACTVTGEHSLPVLEAAHIQPFAMDGPHQVENGLLLRTDIHRLFDQGYVTVTPDHHFLVSRRLKEEFDNGKTYYDLQGRMIRLPPQPADQPSPSLLAWHNEQVFLG